jgi:hypothetical protein
MGFCNAMCSIQNVTRDDWIVQISSEDVSRMFSDFTQRWLNVLGACQTKQYRPVCRGLQAVRQSRIFLSPPPK